VSQGCCRAGRCMSIYIAKDRPTRSNGEPVYNRRVYWIGRCSMIHCSDSTDRLQFAPRSNHPHLYWQRSYAVGSSCLPDSDRPLPLVAWVLTRYTFAACCLLSCCDLGLSCFGCLSGTVLGSCFAGTPVGPPLGCLPIQLLGGNGGGTPFTGRCCGNPPDWKGR